MPTVSKRLRNRKPETIKRALRRAGVPTVTILASKLGKSRCLVSRVISGDIKSTAIAESIAALIGLGPAELWPRIYGSSSEIDKAS